MVEGCGVAVEGGGWVRSFLVAVFGRGGRGGDEGLREHAAE